MVVSDSDWGFLLVHIVLLVLSLRRWWCCLHLFLCGCCVECSCLLLLFIMHFDVFSVDAGCRLHQPRSGFEYISIVKVSSCDVFICTNGKIASCSLICQMLFFSFLLVSSLPTAKLLLDYSLRKQGVGHLLCSSHLSLLLVFAVTGCRFFSNI